MMIGTMWFAISRFSMRLKSVRSAGFSARRLTSGMANCAFGIAAKIVVRLSAFGYVMQSFSFFLAVVGLVSAGMLEPMKSQAPRLSPTVKLLAEQKYGVASANPSTLLTLCGDWPACIQIVIAWSSMVFPA